MNYPTYGPLPDGGYVTRDSGARQKFGSGMQRDTQEGKPRFDLIRPEGEPYEETMLYRLAMLMARGAEKYGDRNWELGDSQDELDRAYASLDRHFEQFRAQVDDGEDHAAAVWFNMIVITKLERLKKAGQLRPRAPKVTIRPDAEQMENLGRGKLRQVEVMPQISTTPPTVERIEDRINRLSQPR